MPLTRARLIAVAVAWLLLGAGQLASAATRKGPCGRGNVRLVAEKYGVTVYVLRDPHYGLTTEACDHRRRLGLDLGGADGRVQYASLDITHSHIGFAISECNENTCLTSVNQLARNPPSGFTVGTADPTGISDLAGALRNRTAVSRLRVGRSGTIAWISCLDGRGGEPNPQLGSCRSARRAHNVYVLPPDPDPTDGERPPTLLDSGHRIDPFSLSVGKKRVIWRNNGRLRSARIPPPLDPVPPRPTTFP